MPCAAYQDPRLAARAWQTWSAEDVEQVEVAGGSVKVCYPTTDARGEHVTCEIRFRFPGEEPMVAVDRLRFLGAADLDRRLHEAGFKEVHMYGDWDRSPLTPNSPEIVVVAGGDGDGDGAVS